MWKTFILVDDRWLPVYVTDLLGSMYNSHGEQFLDYERVSLLEISTETEGLEDVA